ncbi:MAG: CsgG/HfaB family protein [Archangium sp.]
MIHALLISAALAASPVRLAVMPFDNNTPDPQNEVLRRGLADILIADLSTTEGLELVERTRLDDVRRELKLQNTANFDPASRAKLGKMLGATHLVLGGVSAVAPKVSLSVRVMELKGNTVVTSVRVDGSPDDIFSLEDELVKKLLAALRLKFESLRSGHASLPAVMSWAQGVDLAGKDQLTDAQSKLAEAVRLAPDFTLAKEQYAEILKRLREAQKKRGGVLDDRVKTLTEKLTAQLGKPPESRAIAARMGLANLALVQLKALLGAKKDEAKYVEPGKRAEVERLERLFVTHATALVSELRAVRGKNVDPKLDDAESDLSEKTFDLDVGVWDYATPTSVAADLGNFLGSGWSPYRSDVEQFAIRPSVAQRSQKGMEEARGWFELAAKELNAEPADKREQLASKVANERAEMLVILGRREEAVAQWQGFLDKYPTGEDFQVFTKKLEAVMLLDDAAERDEKRLKSCDKALLDGLPELATRTWRAKGSAGVAALGDQLRACSKKDATFERASWTAPAAELQRVADCEAYEALRVKAAKSGTTLEACR